MLVFILCVMFSPDLSFTNLTYTEMAAWWNCHPFLTNLAVIDLFTGSMFLANIMTATTLNIAQKQDECCHSHYDFEDDKKGS